MRVSASRVAVCCWLFASLSSPFGSLHAQLLRSNCCGWNCLAYSRLVRVAVHSALPAFTCELFFVSPDGKLVERAIDGESGGGGGHRLGLQLPLTATRRPQRNGQLPE